MKCTKCGNELRPNDNFCPECGKKVNQKNIMECPMCHQSLDKRVIICPNCKNNIHTYFETQPEPTKTKNKNIKFTTIYVVCCIAAVLGIVYAAESCTGNKPENNDTKVATIEPIATTTDIKVEELTKIIYAKDISFRVSPDWNSDKSHSVYNCSDTCIFTFNFSKISDDLIKTKYNEIYNPNSKTNYFSHREEKLNSTRLIIADYIDSENYYYNAGFFYEGYFYTFCLSDIQDRQEFCSQLGDRILETVELYEAEQKQTEKATEKSNKSNAEKPTEKSVIINNTSTDGFWAKGSGDYVATGLKVTDYGILNITNNGDSNFIVTLYEGDESVDLLVNKIGNYSGKVLINHSGTFDLEIKSSGNWNITSSGLEIDDTTYFSGNGDCVTGITSHSGGNWHLTHNGQSNFIVVEYGLNKGHINTIVNEIGNYDGVAKVENGDNIFFEIIADGDWTIKKE